MSRAITVVMLLAICWCLSSGCQRVEKQTSDRGPDQQQLDKHVSSEQFDPDWSTLMSPEALKEDLDLLLKTLEEVHPNMYAYTTEEEFAHSCDTLYRQIVSPMTPLDFYKLTAPVVASLKSGHTCIRPFLNEAKEYAKANGTVFPLALHWDGVKLIVVKNHSSTTLPIGGALLTINGQPAPDIFSRLSHYIAAEGKVTNPAALERPETLGWFLRLECGAIDSWTIEIKAADGVVKSYTVESVPMSSVAPGQPEPGAQKGQNHYKYLAEYNTALLEITSFGNDLGKFRKFLTESFRKIHDAQVTNLIVDIRENPGGSDMNADALLEYLTAEPYKQFEEARIRLCSQGEKGLEPLRQQQPHLFKDKNNGDMITLEVPLKTPGRNHLRFRGQPFVLIGSGSFSTSVCFAGAIKRFGIGTLVGEETGDPTVLYGNVIHVKLPNSGLAVGVPSRFFVIAGGKPDGRGIIPDHEVKQKPEDIEQGVDTVLQFTLDLISQGE